MEHGNWRGKEERNFGQTRILVANNPLNPQFDKEMKLRRMIWDLRVRVRVNILHIWGDSVIIFSSSSFSLSTFSSLSVHRGWGKEEEEVKWSILYSLLWFWCWFWSWCWFKFWLWTKLRIIRMMNIIYVVCTYLCILHTFVRYVKYSSTACSITVHYIKWHIT